MTELVKVGEVDPPAEIAELFGLAGDEKVLIRRRHMFANDVLIPIAVSYIPMRYAGSVDLAMPDTGPSGICDSPTAVTARFASTRTSRFRSPTVEEQKLLSYGWAAGPVNGGRDPGRPDP
ncbi:hypothetical protein BJ999_004194 [Actinomadura citrea]|uniref:UbiC transcription regulator-associated domain-containing protein n=2 Tax=Actinomadura citrea TaxID=46158 RepID=A0A7Y9KFE5_9ACTN|nr:UTRA domain-containing protein [Actinomadura citrea]NYE13898.1 hypothetical protein [Actinomadura citrea]